MTHESPQPFGESPSSGGMTTQDIANTVEIRDNAYGTILVFWWDWPDEAQLAEFAGQDARAEKDDRLEQADRSIENGPEYATLYFGS